MSKAHLSRVISLYEMIMFEENELKGREQFVRKFTGVIMDEHQDVERDDIVKMPLAEIHNLIFQYRGSNILPGDIELQSVRNKDEVSDQELSAYLSSFQHKHRELNDIFNYQAAAHIFESNGLTYYWVPAELLP